MVKCIDMDTQKLYHSTLYAELLKTQHSMHIVKEKMMEHLSMADATEKLADCKAQYFALAQTEQILLEFLDCIAEGTPFDVHQLNQMMTSIVL